MSQVQQLLESAASGWKNMQSDAAKLAAKWEKTGLLEGLRSETDKNNMSLILENQAKQLVVEQSSVGGGSGYGNFSVGTAPEKKPILEVNDQFARWQILAGIKRN